MAHKPVLYIVIPCYNEESVLPITSGMFRDKVRQLADAGKISDESRILFVNDGSKDKTWEIITALSAKDPCFQGIAQSRNRGHQRAVWAGLMEAKDRCDITISIDCDGQDDINAMDAMVDAYLDGCEIVYGVRSKRDTDTFFKRFTAEGFYKLLSAMGAEVVFNHADYRLISSRALQELAKFREVNLYLRGMVPLVGFKSTSVSYERHERIAGESHYPLKKMLGLAFDKPIGQADSHGVLRRAVYHDSVIYWHYLGGDCRDCRAFGGWLGVAGLSGMLRWRDAVPVSGYHRGIHRQNLLGSQAASAVYYFGTHSGDG